ncbi:hypothetical protein I7I50_05185 [Histoplasma capsulatum G186AR]|uniref:Uncharacterized protein n=1 Tax=Ajellomyces capsulatus TaxID=5037 RepID=A0A8H8D9U7_AJECA|nr:hypothetical protein I7I52_03443 [Histoplasma capsulatum]QSS75897.1 hypothetical protein I7I50_05185 [Histoplasma capsulatum G186AR]
MSLLENTRLAPRSKISWCSLLSNKRSCHEINQLPLAIKYFLFFFGRFYILGILDHNLGISGILLARIELQYSLLFGIPGIFSGQASPSVTALNWSWIRGEILNVVPSY